MSKDKKIKEQQKRIGLLGSVIYVALEVAYIAEREGPHDRPI